MKTLKKIFKWTFISVLVLILVVSSVVAFLQNKKYDAPYPAIKATSDSSVIAQGKYLFYGPAHCMDCHTNKNDYPQITEMEQMPPTGNFRFELPVGVITTPNITSDMETGIGKLTDGEIARTLRYGVGSDGRAIFDFMPFHNTSDEDLTAIISYLRTIRPVKKKIPPVELNLLGNVVKAFILKPVGPEGEVPASIKRDASVEYGKYLANNVANCKGCHTNRDMMTGEFIGEDFSGGLKIDVPDKPGLFVVTRNLTPDPKTGQISHWTKEQFIQRFRAGKLIPESPMPWGPFQKMSDDDLTSIYLYLKTIKPVHNDPGPVLITQI